MANNGKNSQKCPEVAESSKLQFFFMVDFSTIELSPNEPSSFPVELYLSYLFRAQCWWMRMGPPRFSITDKCIISKMQGRVTNCIVSPGWPPVPAQDPNGVVQPPVPRQSRTARHGGGDRPHRGRGSGGGPQPRCCSCPRVGPRGRRGLGGPAGHWGGGACPRGKDGTKPSTDLIARGVGSGDWGSAEGMAVVQGELQEPHALVAGHNGGMALPGNLGGFGIGPKYRWRPTLTLPGLLQRTANFPF